MPYTYDKHQSNPPTVDEMFGEYKMAVSWLTVSAFIDLYPEVTDSQLAELRLKYENQTRLIKKGKNDEN